MYLAGFATWSDNGKSIILKKTRGAIKLRDVSCRMPIGVAERAIGGCALAQAMIEAWKFTLAA